MIIFVRLLQKFKVMNNQLAILKDLKNQLLEIDLELIKEVILLGSQAHGNATEDSDYDILILVSRKPSLNEKAVISDVCYDIDLKYDILIDSHILSIPELKLLRERQPIYQTAISKGIHA